MEGRARPHDGGLRPWRCTTADKCHLDMSASPSINRLFPFTLARLHARFDSHLRFVKSYRDAASRHVGDAALPAAIVMPPTWCRRRTPPKFIGRHAFSPPASPPAADKMMVLRPHDASAPACRQ